VAEGIEPNPGPLLYWSDIRVEIRPEVWNPMELATFEEKLASAVGVPFEDVRKITLQRVNQYAKSQTEQTAIILAVLDACEMLLKQKSGKSSLASSPSHFCSRSLEN